MRKLSKAYKEWGNKPFEFEFNVPIWPATWFHFSWKNDKIIVGLISMRGH